MDNKTTSIFFTSLLFLTVSAARPTVSPPVTIPTTVRNDDHSSNLPNKIFLRGGMVTPEPTTPEKTTFDVTQHENRTNFHPINRHFRGQHHKPTETNRKPCPMHMTYNPKPEERTDKPKPEPENWMKVKHQYRSRRHHNIHKNKNDENVIKTKNVFDREKLKRLSRQQKQKKSDDKNGLMKNIRKFLKHTFD